MDTSLALQKFRSKYPGAYDHYTDKELLSALQKKFPGAYNHLTVPEEKLVSENILQRAGKALKASAMAGMQNAGNPLGVSVNPHFPFIPGMPTDSPSLSAGMEEAEMPITQGNPMAQAGMSLASNMLAGGMLGGGAVSKKIGESVENLKNPSGVFGNKISEIQKSQPAKRVDFLKILSKASDDPMANKVIEKSGVMNKYGGNTMDETGAVTEHLSNLDLKKSQDLMNDLKVGLRQAIKEGHVKSNERGISQMLGELAGEQDKAFGKEFKDARGSYGFSKKLSKGLKSAGKTATRGAIYGAGLGTGGAAGYQVFKHLHE